MAERIYLPEEVQPNSENWRDFAACAQVSPDLWFPDRGAKAREAREICDTSCEVREFCLEWAVQSTDTQFGIWGGKTPAEIRAIRKQRKLDGAELPEDIEPEDESVYNG